MKVQSDLKILFGQKYILVDIQLRNHVFEILSEGQHINVLLKFKPALGITILVVLRNIFPLFSRQY